mmetsp:Transcript_30204/g.55489  ORF Transcript_30204/g.55489 Transcript_30204/m.55489 type:complete len:269 (+) Transcript_30204:777-1583(+)
MAHLAVYFVLAGDVLGVVFLLGVGPGGFELVDFDGDVAHVLEVEGAPDLGEAALAEEVEEDVSIVQLSLHPKLGSVLVRDQLERTDMAPLFNVYSSFLRIQLHLLLLHLIKMHSDRFIGLHPIQIVQHDSHIIGIRYLTAPHDTAPTLIRIIRHHHRRRCNGPPHGQLLHLPFQPLPLLPQLRLPRLQHPRSMTVLPRFDHLAPYPAHAAGADARRHEPPQPRPVARELLTQLLALPHALLPHQAFHHLGGPARSYRVLPLDDHEFGL